MLGEVRDGCRFVRLLLRRDADFVPAKNGRFALGPFSEYDPGAGESSIVWD